MSRLSRSLTLSALSFGFAITLAAPPAQARERPSSGWLGALAHEVAYWATGWWPLGEAAAASPGRSQRTPSAVRLPGERLSCGTQIDPDGCPSAPRLASPARPPGRLRVECGTQIDPNGHCM
jgi:hypothetical protein